MNAVLLLPGAAVITALFLAAALLAVPHRSTPGTLPFVLVCLSLAPLPGAVVARWLWEVQTGPFLFSSFAVAGLAWFVLAFEYTGRGPTVTRTSLGFLTLFGSATILGVLVGSSLDGLLRDLVFFSNTILQMTLFAAIVYGVFLVGRSTIRYDDLSPGSSLVLGTLGVGLLLLFFVAVLTPQLPAESLQGPQLLLLGVIASVLSVTQLRYDVFEGGPSAGHLARETVFDEMSQAAFIVDRDNRVLDCNRSAVRLFGPDRERLVGNRIDDVFWADDRRGTAVSAGADESESSGRVAISGWDAMEDDAVVLDTLEGRRQFAVQHSVLTTESDESIGRASLFEDVTERTTHEQRIDVLNRVLRHNLRNDLDAIDAFAEALEQETAATDPVETLDRIHETAAELAELGEMVGRTERLLARDDRQLVTVDVHSLLRELCADCRNAYPGVAVTVDAVTEDAVVRTDRALLEAVLREVVENALEHNDSADPHVEVTVGTTDGDILVEVRDDGPGIPAEERDVLLDGEETPLRHGSGIGLWFVHWGLVQLGGELDLRANEPRGSVVSLVLPSLAS